MDMRRLSILQLLFLLQFWVVNNHTEQIKILSYDSNKI